MSDDYNRNRPLEETIRQLRAEIERLRAALQKIVEMEYTWTSADAIARRALEEEQGAKTAQAATAPPSHT
jgi:hypothetical protein